MSSAAPTSAIAGLTALAARQVTSAATVTTRSTRTVPDEPSNAAETTIDDYSYQTSTIVRTAVVSGVIVLVVTALVLFFKITSWIRFHQRQRRQKALHRLLQNEQRANAYEIAAWADEPGSAPVKGGKRADGDKKKGRKLPKRGAANAYGVSEWEGVAQ